MKRAGILMLLCGQIMINTSQAQPAARQRPFVSFTEVGGLFGRVVSGPVTSEVVQTKISLTLQTLNGVQLTPRTAVGGLLGIDWYKAALLMPVGAGIRFRLTDHVARNVSLLAGADAGYATALLHRNSTGYALKGGFMINPGLSLRFGRINDGGILLAIGYKWQQASVEKPLRWNEVVRYEKRIYNRLALRLGFTF